MVQKGEAVGVVVANQSENRNTIDFENLRWWSSRNISEENRLVAKFDGIAEIEDLKTVRVRMRRNEAILSYQELPN